MSSNNVLLKTEKEKEKSSVDSLIPAKMGEISGEARKTLHKSLFLALSICPFFKEKNLTKLIDWLI